jgi:hypothetical protein
MIAGSLSYILMKAAITAVIATALWYAWTRWRNVPNAEKTALAYGAMMFVALVAVFAVFEWAIS